MKKVSAVLLKSFPNGIALHFNSEIPFSELLEEVKIKFLESKKFFQNANLALSVEGRDLSMTEEQQLVSLIEEVSDIHILCILEKNPEKDQQFLKALGQTQQGFSDNSAKIYRGTLKNGQAIESHDSIVVIGDVNPGCKVSSAKDIIILGGLYGEAYAGYEENEENHFVAALELQPEKLKIGALRYRSKEKPKWTIKSKLSPTIAYDKDGEIFARPITKEILENLPFA